MLAHRCKRQCGLDLEHIGPTVARVPGEASKIIYEVWIPPKSKEDAGVRLRSISSYCGAGTMERRVIIAGMLDSEYEGGLIYKGR
jgi:hypothetical protein